MTLLEEIQKEAVDSKSDLASLLRKCKLLAARIGSKQLEDWVIWESNGYPEDAPVPDYRIWPLEVRGHFVGPYNAAINNHHIPNALLPKKARDLYSNYKCRQSIASIEAILAQASKGGPKGTLTLSTGDLALILGDKVIKYYTCMETWAEAGEGRLVEITNSVRNRILDFALAMWKENPNAGEIDTKKISKIEPEKVTQIFNTTVFGGSASLVGTSNASSIQFNIQQNDFSSLERVLIENEVSQNDISELREALDSDSLPTSPERFGPKVSAWIAKMVEKAASGAWKIGLGAAGSLLAQAIAKYYGLL